MHTAYGRPGRVGYCGGMERYPYESHKIKHLKGQVGPIEDPDKAFVMAGIENEQRKTAGLYEEYRKDPRHFKKPLQRGLKKEFAAWHKKGISPEYIRRIGEQLAEQAGSILDYEKSIGGKTDSELKKDIRNNVVPLIFQIAMSAIHKDWEQESETVQNPSYQYRASQSVVTTSTIELAFQELRDRKDDVAVEENLA